MVESINTAIFQIKKTIKDIKNYDRDWKYTDTFKRYVTILNNFSKQLELPLFNFENFHFSSTGKTINDVGYNSLMNHIDTLEEMLPYIRKNRNSKTKSSSKGDNIFDEKKIFIVHGRNKQALLETVYRCQTPHKHNSSLMKDSLLV